MRHLFRRADQLYSLPGMTRHRVLARLKREFPHTDRDLLVRASRIEGAPTGGQASWVQMNGNLLHPVTISRDPRKRLPYFPATVRTVTKGELMRRQAKANGALTIDVDASELLPGDMVAGQGLVGAVIVRGTVIAQIGGRHRILPKTERLTIHLEDDGLNP